MKSQIIEENQNATLSSGHHLSFWVDSVEPIKFTPLDKDCNADVAVVGAGIAGMSTAYQLAKAGKKVVVLEDGYVGSGETGRTTAHLVNALDDFYTYIEKYHGQEGSRLAAESHSEAINFIERTCLEEQISCDFQRLDGYLFLHPTDEVETLEKELEASHRAGLKTELLNETPGLSKNHGVSLHFPNQGQFHVLKYLKGLADAFVRMGGVIYTETKVDEIGNKTLRANGFTVAADAIVVATNSPINNIVTMHTKQYAYRTYVVGITVPKDTVEPALWWDTGDQESKWLTKPYTYVRTQKLDDKNDLILCGGQDHKTGQGEEESITEDERYNRLIGWVKENFPMAGEVVYRWSGQVLETLDAVAYIGKNPGDENIFIVTGDSGNGMTHGTIAGILLTDLILNKPNPWSKLYDPSRITLQVTKDYLSEAVCMVAQYTDVITPGDVDNIDEIENGEGAIVRKGLSKYAVFKDQSGATQAFSAICPHLGGIVRWNADEKSFDCPCHGSRFTANGEVINGPAIENLAKIDLDTLS